MEEARDRSSMNKHVQAMIRSENMEEYIGELESIQGNGDTKAGIVDPNFNERLLEQLSWLNIGDTANDIELSLTNECIRLKELLKSDNMSKQEKDAARDELIQTYKKLLEARNRYDKAISALRHVKSQYYSSDVNKKALGSKTRDVIGAEDPFHKSFNALYPEKGFKGFVEENPDLFQNVQPKDIDQASKSYVKVEGKISSKLRKYGKLPLVVLLVLGYLLFVSSMMSPFFYAFGSVGFYHVIMDCLFSVTDEHRWDFNQKIFDARDRIGRDMGLIERERPIDDMRDLVAYDNEDEKS